MQKIIERPDSRSADNRSAATPRREAGLHLPERYEFDVRNKVGFREGAGRVLVFASNIEGDHVWGIASMAVRGWGLCPGVSSRRSGNAYAIPTRRGDGRTLVPLPVADIARFVEDFLHYAYSQRNDDFLVTAIGEESGLVPEAIASMFNGAPRNCIMPPQWRGLFRWGSPLP